MSLRYSPSGEGAFDHRLERRTRLRQGLGRLGVGRFERPIAAERSVEFDRQPIAVVLHQGQFFVGVAALGVDPPATLDRRLEQIDRRLEALQRWLERTEGHWNSIL